MKYVGNLTVTSENVKNFKDLEEVTGDLRVDGTAKLEALTSVGGDLRVDGTAKLEALTSVGGYLRVYGTAKLEALTSVGGYLLVDGECSFPSLKIAHGVEGCLICVKKYGLWYSTDHKFYAGCQGPMTKRQAIALSKKWDDQETAQYMANFINEIDSPVES
jgi:hypothetical protein